MGLCKCRTVTNLFCFEHRKNVCEKCVVAEHPLCVVQSYLQWLKDSDFDPSCPICGKDVRSDGNATIRLLCYDLLHKACLLQYCKSKMLSDVRELQCPIGTCRMAVVPIGQSASPLAKEIRQVFEKTQWETAVQSLAKVQSARGSRAIEFDLDKSGINALKETQANGINDSLTIEVGSAVKSNHESPLSPYATSGDRTRLLDIEESKFAASRQLRRSGMISVPFRASLREKAKNIARILGNCVMLRNLRRLSCGISPRQLVLVCVACVILIWTVGQLLWTSVPVTTPVSEAIA